MAKIRKLTGGRAWAARLLVLLPVILILGLVVAVLPASGASITPEKVTGNPDCSTYGWQGHQFKYEPVGVGTQTFDLQEGIQLQFTIASNRRSVTSFDLSIDGFVAGQAGFVIVKSGTDANVYDYANKGGAVQEDTNLASPFRDISHVTFCYQKVPLFSISGTKTEVNFAGDAIGPEAGRSIFLFKSSEPIAQTTTNADGFYEFTDLLAGTYTVCEALNLETEFEFDPSEFADPGDGIADCSALGAEGALAPRGHIVSGPPDSAGNDFDNVIADEGGVIVRATCGETFEADVTTSTEETIQNDVTPLCVNDTQVLLLNPVEFEGQTGVQLKFVITELAPVIWATTFPDEDAPDLSSSSDAQISAILYLENPEDIPVALPWCVFENGDPVPPEGFFACEVNQSGTLVTAGTISVSDIAVVTGDPTKLR